MTSEVCVMNRHAVVLAADSATTVTAWTSGVLETRYFKGANKIFQLSNHRPVGLMIFGSADTHRVPWEIAVKEFRGHLGDKSFNELEGYAEEFFGYLESDVRLFPESLQHSTFVAAAERAAATVVLGVERQPDQSDGDHLAAVDVAVREAREGADAVPIPPRLAADAMDKALIWREEIEKGARDILRSLKHQEPSADASLADLGAALVIKGPADAVGSTGLVVAGYGDHAIFPSMIEFNCAGLVLGKLAVHEANRNAVDHDVPAAISAFAQTSMSDTFQSGFSQDVYVAAMQAVQETLADFATKVVAETGGDATKGDLANLIVQGREAVSKAWLDRARTAHVYPLRRVLGALPIDEMAELAETLINLQSLKEKVTKPSEEVGGPIDVAVITKNEGLVWIKRKHFFDAALNPRFVQRLAAMYK